MSARLPCQSLTFSTFIRWLETVVVETKISEAQKSTLSVSSLICSNRARHLSHGCGYLADRLNEATQ